MQNLCPVHANKSMFGPNKENSTSFVLWPSRGSEVKLSEVKVNEGSLPSDSLS